MSHDHELLKMAAKAIQTEIWTDCNGNIYCGRMINGNEVEFPWSPLTDDGDAMRLAGKLWITIGPERAGVIGQSLVRASWHGNSYSLGEYGGGDYQVAARRAIVRAAAEIGKAMP